MSISVAKHTRTKPNRLKQTNHIIIRSKLKFNKKQQRLTTVIQTTMLKSLNNNPNNPSGPHHHQHHHHHYNNHNHNPPPQHRAYPTPYSYHNSRQLQPQLQQEPSFNQPAFSPRQPQPQPQPPSTRGFNPNRYKKSKSIKIGTSATSSTNHSRFSANSHSFNNSSALVPPSAAFQQFGASLLEQFSNNSSSNQTPVATMAAVAAAATLANLLRSDAQSYAPNQSNNNNSSNINKNSQYYSNLNKFNSHCNFKFKSNAKARFLNSPFKVSHGAHYQRANSFNNRSKHFFSNKPGSNTFFGNSHSLATGGLNLATKNNAPYNTTQYIMYDYSKRRSLKEQECPNEQQQFSDDWNRALAQKSSALCPLDLESIILNNRKLGDESSATSPSGLKFMSRSESDSLNRVSSELEEAGGGEAMETGSSEAPDQVNTSNSNSVSVGLLLSSSL